MRHTSCESRCVTKFFQQGSKKNKHGPSLKVGWPSPINKRSWSTLAHMSVSQNRGPPKITWKWLILVWNQWVLRRSWKHEWLNQSAKFDWKFARKSSRPFKPKSPLQLLTKSLAQTMPFIYIYGSKHVQSHSKNGRQNDLQGSNLT